MRRVTRVLALFGVLAPLVAATGSRCGPGQECDVPDEGVLLQHRSPRPAPTPGGAAPPAPAPAFQGVTVTLGAAGAPLQQPPVIVAGNAEPITLQVETIQICVPQSLANTPKGVAPCFLTRAYSTPSIAASIPGPTIVVSPGQNLSITLVNNLANPDPACPSTFSSKNPGFCIPNTTNLHTHGLHVSPQPGADSIWTFISPGKTFDYSYEILPYHTAGTFWYHPHVHHAASIQAGGGMAGALLVADPPNSLPPQVQNMTEVVLVMTLINAAASTNDLMMGVWGQSAMEQYAQGNLWKYSNGDQVNLGSQVVFVNGQYMPTMTIESGQWYRLRIIYAAVWSSTTAKLLDAGCQLQLLAKDGIYLSTAPRLVDALYLASGQRADVALMCTCSGTAPCSNQLAGASAVPGPGTALDSQEFLKEGAEQAAQSGPAPGVSNSMQQVLLQITIQPSSTAAADLPAFSVTRPCYLADLTNVDVPTANQGRLELTNPNTFAVQYAPGMSGGTVSGSPMMSMTPGNFLGNLSVGQVYEFLFEGPVSSSPPFTNGHGLALHPFHFHVNPYQIVALPDASTASTSWLQVGDWQDVLLWPAGMQATVKFQTDYWVGHQIMHCHNLAHEDMGMMGYFNITGTQGSQWPGAQQADPTCYTAAGGAGYTLVAL